MSRGGVKILEQIDAEAIARDTLDFVSVKSETGQEGEGSRFLADLLRREGFQVTDDEVEPGRSNIYVRIPGRNASSARALLFNGHTDTIPIGQCHQPKREGDFILGRGTEDMKGGLVAMVHAASALRKAGVELDGDLWLTGVIGHETPIGKKEGPKRLIQMLDSGDIAADAIVIVEGPCAIWAASLGSTIFTVTISTDRGPIHTIKTRFCENPAYWAGKLLVEFQRLEDGYAAQPAHPLCGRQQLNVGMLHGGDYFNRLPVAVAVTGTRRWTPGTDLSDVREEFAALCGELERASGLSFRVDFEEFREPFETAADDAVIQSLQTACRETVQRDADIVGMGLVGDANLYANDGGTTTVYYGPAHETAHSDHERVSISQLAHCARVYALTALDFCGPTS
jgi:acetylornithine deacetylase/succinyl-diaminopimelate desuccinylase-like protein